jgi:uncharacterized protein
MNRKQPMQTRTGLDSPVPWWRVGVMWLVVGGLGLVVVASFALLATAMRHADVVQPHSEIQAAVPNTSSSPAMLARNHSATPPK